MKDKLAKLEKYVFNICADLVDTPEAIIVISQKLNGKYIIVVSSDFPEEVGQLIGEKGVIANSIRTLLKVVARRIDFDPITLTVTSQVDCRFNDPKQPLE